MLLFVSGIMVIASFLLLGQLSLKWIWTRILYFSILIMATGIIGVLFVFACLYEIARNETALFILFPISLAYTSYYLYRMIKHHKKMPCWCWLIFLIPIFVSGRVGWEVVDYITRPDNSSSFVDHN